MAMHSTCQCRRSTCYWAAAAAAGADAGASAGADEDVVVCVLE